VADPVECLSVDAIIDLHAQALTDGHGGLDGIRSHPQLASAAVQPYQSFGGEDLYPSIPEKPAAHAYFLAESQPFLDGNKRTAALVLTVLLDLHGYQLYEASEVELATS
jgi:death on curing protein